MAIQIPNPGTGNGASGDNEFVLWSKVKDNFTNTTHAANRLVGTATGNLIEVGTFGMGAIGSVPLYNFTAARGTGIYSGGGAGAINYPAGSNAANMSLVTSNRTPLNNILAFGGSGAAIEIYSVDIATNLVVSSAKVYTDKNTTIVNGSLKPSSPVVKIHTDSLELNDDAEKMGVTLNKRGVGDYLIQNTTGLRSDGGWRIELPQDVNGNPYFAVDYNELENNDIEVKTYKRIFDMNTFMFGPDLDNPVDIKEGRSIAIRFNDLPLDDIQTEV